MGKPGQPVLGTPLPPQTNQDFSLVPVRNDPISSVSRYAMSQARSPRAPIFEVGAGLTPAPRQLQAKLTVNEPGDKYEQEADRVADLVMRLPNDAVQTAQVSSSSRSLQRKCTVCEEEKSLHRSESGTAPAVVSPLVNKVLNRPGQPLPNSARNFFESRMRADLSGVRVHDDAAAAASADAVHARAYTVGNNVVFATGEYTPHTDPGRRLLAHELSHVVQQDRGMSELRRAPNDAGAMTGADRTSANNLDQEYRTAVSIGDWQAAAEWLNGFNRVDILSRLSKLSQQQIANVHQGALDNAQVGPGSQVAQLTAPTQSSVSNAQSSAAAPHTEPSPTDASPTNSSQTSARSGKTIAEWSFEEKALAAYDRADIKQAFREKLLSLVTPRALCLAIISFAAAFVFSQLSPIGWAADIGILLTAAFIAPALDTAIRHLVRFADVRNATRPEDLDQAGAELAAALAEIGVDAVIIAVTHASGGPPKGGAPLPGPPMTVTLGVGQYGQLALVATETIPLTVSVGLGVQGAAAATELSSAMTIMSQGPPRAGAISRQFEPPVRDHTGQSGQAKAGGNLPHNGAERAEAIKSWTREELEFSAQELRESISARQNEQRMLGEDTPAGANHRVRIEQELDLLRAIEKALKGS